MSEFYVKPGDSVTFAKTVGETDIYLFAGITGDFAVNHVNEQYMARSKYGRRIAHGALLIGFASTCSSMMIEKCHGTAGDETPVSLGYDKVRFLGPVYIGDTLTLTYTISEVDLAKCKAKDIARRGNRRGVRQLAVRHHLRAAGRIVRRHDFDPCQRAQKPLALRERLRMRVDSLDRRHRGPGKRQKVVHDRYFDLTHDRQVVLDEEIVVTVNAPADRVLDRQDPVRGRSVLDGVKHILEALARHERRVPAHEPRCGLAERAGLSLIGNLHSRRTKKRAIIPSRMMAFGVRSPALLHPLSPSGATVTGTNSRTRMTPTTTRSRTHPLAATFSNRRAVVRRVIDVGLLHPRRPTPSNRFFF